MKLMRIFAEMDSPISNIWIYPYGRRKGTNAHVGAETQRSSDMYTFVVMRSQMYKLN